MDNLWLLTEERPKPSVVKQIIDIYCNDFDDKITLLEEIKIKPLIKNGVFSFVYEVEGLKVNNANLYSPEDIIEKIKAITKEDVIYAAKGVNLHTVYKLLPKEGVIC